MPSVVVAPSSAKEEDWADAPSLGGKAWLSNQEHLVDDTNAAQYLSNGPNSPEGGSKYLVTTFPILPEVPTGLAQIPRGFEYRIRQAAPGLVSNIESEIIITDVNDPTTGGAAGKSDNRATMQPAPGLLATTIRGAPDDLWNTPSDRLGNAFLTNMYIAHRWDHDPADTNNAIQQLQYTDLIYTYDERSGSLAAATSNIAIAGSIGAWSDNGAPFADDDVTTATVGVLTAAGQYSDLLYTTFDFSAIADDAVVSGLVVELNVQVNFGPFAARTIQFMSDANEGALIGENRASQCDPALPYTQEIGGESDTWGLNLTGADLKAPGFGLGIQVEEIAGLTQVSFTTVRVRVITGGQPPVPPSPGSNVKNSNLYGPNTPAGKKGGRLRVAMFGRINSVADRTPDNTWLFAPVPANARPVSLKWWYDTQASPLDLEMAPVERGKDPAWPSAGVADPFDPARLMVRKPFANPGAGTDANGFESLWNDFSYSPDENAIPQFLGITIQEAMAGSVIPGYSDLKEFEYDLGGINKGGGTATGEKPMSMIFLYAVD